LAAFVVIIGFVCALSSATVWADNEVFDARGFNPNRDFFSQLPYEHIDPLTGNVLLTFTDLVLPGNAGFDLKIQRTYNSKIFTNVQTGDAPNEDSWAGLGWTLHLGRVLNANNTGGAGPPPGPIEMPDGSRHKLYNLISGSSVPCTGSCFITRDFWVYINASIPVLLLPNGTKYTFGRSTTLPIGGTQVAVKYPTRIEDPFGNVVTVTYMTGASDPLDGISSIVQDLGGGTTRAVTFTALTTPPARKTLNTMTYSGTTTHVWTYTQVDANAVGFSLLTNVQPPVGPSWKYDYNITGSAVSPCTVSSSFHNELVRVTTPNGGQIDYVYCNKEFHLGSPVLVTTRSVIQRTTGGRGITAGTWTYEYALGTSENQTRITAPSSCGTITTTYTFMGVGNDPALGNVWKIGLLQRRVTADSVGALETEALTWTPSAQISPDTESVGNNRDVGIPVPLFSTRTVTRGTTNPTNYSTTNTYNGIGTCPFGGTHESFNDYGRPCIISEQGQLSRKTERFFQYGFTPYIKDRIQSETVTVPATGTESFTKSFAYNLATGFKTGETIYGISKTLGPDPRGNIASVTDANTHTTRFSYERGLSRSLLKFVS
jgi:hypothetical protein